MRRPLSLMSLACALAASTAADPGGVLVGGVHTAEGTPLPQLVLVLTGPGGPHTVVTGPQGRFRVPGLALGSYTVVAEAPGFVLAPEPRVTVAEGETRLDLVLLPAPVREKVVVTATRGEAALSTIGVSATVLDSGWLAAREAGSLTDLLREVPGVAVTRLGGIGPQSSAFVRGGESRFARVLVDGVPVNEPGGAYNFGGVLPLELERLEVVRGAASALYSTDALGGVIHLITRRAAAGDRPGLHAEAEGGSFAWRRAQAGSSGRSGGFDWNAGLQRLETDNEEPNAAFEQTSGAGSLGVSLGEATQLRLVVRGETGRAGIPGPTAFGRADLEESYERRGWVAAAHVRRLGLRTAHEWRAGAARSRQLSRDPGDSGSFVPRWGDRVAPFPSFDFVDRDGFLNDTTRLSLGYQVERGVGGRHLITAGVELERESGDLGPRPDDLISPSRTNLGVYVQDRVVLGDRWFLTVGARLERNDSFGTQAVPRAALAWRARSGDDATTVKASAGRGIKEPSFFESFGSSAFVRGNPDLTPERSRTWDVGVEQRLLGGRLRVEATAFRHTYQDQIAFRVLSFTPFRGSYENLGATRGQGIELAAEAAPSPRLRLSAHYTYLHGRILVDARGNNSDAPLLRRPGHQGSLTARAELGRLDLGATLVYVGRRADNDFLALELDESPAYTRLDARGSWRLGRGLEVFAVGENLLDRAYQEVLGYPALGRGVRLGLRYRTGAP